MQLVRPPCPSPSPAVSGLSAEHTLSNLAHSTDCGMNTDTSAVRHSRITANTSSTAPPHPNSLMKPPPIPKIYTVVTVGEEVGLFDEQNEITFSRIPMLSSFSMRRFADWDAARSYYTRQYFAGEVLLALGGGNQQPVPPLPTIQSPVVVSGLADTLTGTRDTVSTSSNPPVAPAPHPFRSCALTPAADVSTSGTTTGQIPGPSFTDILKPSAPLPTSYHKDYYSVQPSTPTSAAPTITTRPVPHSASAVTEHSASVLRRVKAIRRSRIGLGMIQSKNSKKLRKSAPSSGARRTDLFSKGKGRATTPVSVVHGDSHDSSNIDGNSSSWLHPLDTESLGLKHIDANNHIDTNHHIDTNDRITPFTDPDVLPLLTVRSPTPAIFVSTPPSAVIPTPFSSPVANPSSNSQHLQIAQDISHTAKSLSSQKRLRLIEEALASMVSELEPPFPPSPSPIPGSLRRLAAVAHAFAATDAVPHTPSRKLTPRIASAGPSRRSRSVRGLVSTDSPPFHSSFGGSDRIPAYSARPESDYGVSDMESAFLEEASIFSD